MNKTAKKILAVIIAAAVIIAVLIIALIIAFNAYTENRAKEVTSDASALFEEIYDYVRENREVFEEFSEYQVSLLSEENPSFIVEQTGDMQEKRDIALKYFTASAGNDIYGRTGVKYTHPADSFTVYLCYFKDGVTKEESYYRRPIGDYMAIEWIRTHY